MREIIMVRDTNGWYRAAEETKKTDNSLLDYDFSVYSETAIELASAFCWFGLTWLILWSIFG